MSRRSERRRKPCGDAEDDQRVAFAARFPKLLAVEELPYHDLGRTKAKRIGAEYNVPLD